MHELRLPVPENVLVAFGVYAASLRVHADMKAITLAWVSRHFEDVTLRRAITAAVESRLHVVNVVPVASAPPTELETLRLMGMGAAEERRLTRATHFISAATALPFTPAPAAYLSARAAANAIALALDGVVVDVAGPRALPLSTRDQPIIVRDALPLGRHMKCLYWKAPDGSITMRTLGMLHFAMPELNMRGIPPEAAEDTIGLLTAVAQGLLQTVMKASPRFAKPGVRELAVPVELTVEAKHLAMAYAKETAGSGSTTVALSLATADGVDKPFLRVSPPAAYRGELARWYARARAELVEAPQAPPIMRSPDDMQLERARVRALAEWPGIRERFLRGLDLDQDLLVKRAFRVASGRTEHMWVDIENIEQGQVVGVLANHSAYDPSLRCGVRARFPETEITDWMIVEGDKREGGYSMAALGD